MTKKDIKDIFHQKGMQITPGAIEMIQDDLRRKVRHMAKRCKNGNVKRLTEEIFFIALGKLSG